MKYFFYRTKTFTWKKNAFEVLNTLPMVKIVKRRQFATYGTFYSLLNFTA